MPLRARVIWIAAVVGLAVGVGTLFSFSKFSTYSIIKTGTPRFSEARLKINKRWRPCFESPRGSRRMPLIMCGVEAEEPSRESQLGTVANTRGYRSGISDRQLMRIIRSKNRSEIDAVVQQLESEVEKNPDNLLALNHLAFTYSVRANLFDRPYDLALALARSLDSIEIDPQQEDVLFNVALFCTKLHLEKAARVSWRRYLSTDRDSEWANEARIRLEVLEQPLESIVFEKFKIGAGTKLKEQLMQAARISPQLAREWITEEVLPSWGGQWLDADYGRAAESLRVAKIVSEALAETENGDQTPLLATEAISGALKSNRLEIIKLLAQGHVYFGRGRKLDRLDHVDGAIRLLNISQSCLKRAESPFEVWVSFFRASAGLGLIPYEQTDTEVKELLKGNSLKRMPALSGLGSWLRGLIQIRQGNYEYALSHYKRAEQLFASIGERDNLGGVLELTSEAYRYLGQRYTQWEYAYSALEALRGYPTSKRLHNILWDTAETTLQDGDRKLSLLLHTEDIEVARFRGEPAVLSEALIRRALTLAADDQIEAAEQDLRVCRLLTPRIEDKSLRDSTLLRLFLTTAKINAIRDPQKAIPDLATAVESYMLKSKPLEVLEALLAKVHCYLAIGDNANAEKDINQGIELIEKQGRVINDRGLGLSFSDLNSSLFDLRIDLALKRNELPEAILEFSERSRRLYGDLLPRKPGPYVERGYEKEDRPIIVYHLTEDNLLIFSIVKGKVTLTSVEAEPVLRQVQSIRRSVQIGDERGFMRAAAQLYVYLIPESLMGAANSHNSQELIVIPDSLLHSVPFAALYNSRTKKFVAEQFALTTAPSIRLYLYSQDLQFDKPLRRPFRVLIANGRTWNSELFPDLDQLKGSKKEIEDIVKAYSEFTYLDSPVLGATIFLRESASHEVVHFTGHSIFRADENGSFLILGPDPNDGLLYSKKVPNRELSATRLMVLASCSTVLGTTSRTGGLQSLGGAFIFAGVPSVVGSLWDINDSEASEFFRRFHFHYASGLNAAAAVQKSQIEMLSGKGGESHRVMSWSAYQVIGTP